MPRRVAAITEAIAFYHSWHTPLPDAWWWFEGGHAQCPLDSQVSRWDKHDLFETASSLTLEGTCKNLLSLARDALKRKCHSDCRNLNVRSNSYLVPFPSAHGGRIDALACSLGRRCDAHPSRAMGGRAPGGWRRQVAPPPVRREPEGRARELHGCSQYSGIDTPTKNAILILGDVD